MGDKVNVLIDNLRSVLSRLIDLPTLFWVFLLLAGFLLIWMVLIWLSRRRGRPKPGIGAMALMFAILSLLIISLQVDKRFSRQQSAMESLDRKLFKLNDELGELEFRTRDATDSIYGAGRMTLLKLDSFRNDWQENYLVSERKLNDWTEVAILRIFKPQASVFLAVVDLSHEKLEIVLDDELPEQKYLTSSFAKENDCFLAINGEAGETPYQGSGYGEWVGNYISASRVLMMKDDGKRPFISFDEQNKAFYSEASIVDTIYSAQKFNTIYGRFDILHDGEISQFENDLQYPRTIMGIDSKGEKLYLMIVDGSQPDYSMGLKYSYCAQLLKYLGASSAMACDQGGSSCMYVKQMGGIINRPRDGRERVVYTHFGIKERAVPD